MNSHQILTDVKNAIRHPYAWPGGYPVYTVLSDGELLCPACAKENFKLVAHSTIHPYNRDGWQAVGAEVFWEGEATCGHCGKPIESAYGNPE